MPEQEFGSHEMDDEEDAFWEAKNRSDRATEMWIDDMLADDSLIESVPDEEEEPDFSECPSLPTIENGGSSFSDY